MIRFRIATRQQITREFQDLRLLLERATDTMTGELNATDVLAQLLQGQRSLLVIEDLEQADPTLAVGVLSIVTHPRKTLLQVDALAGREMDEWLEQLLVELDRLANQAGADMVRVYGRPGWARKLKPYGYGHQSVALTKQVGA